MSDATNWLRSYGLVIDHPINDGRWHRVPTDDHPKKRNGAYMVDGELVVCQNWATMPEAVRMPRDGSRPMPTQAEVDAADRRAKARAQEKFDERRKARQKAAALLAEAKPGTHGYLVRKGFPDELGLVLPDATLFIPMRSMATSALVGGQCIRWDQEERVWDKKYLYGQASRGAGLRLGNADSREVIMCEGYATGLSINAALQKMRLGASVVVCFSANNLVELAASRGNGRYMVFADHDAPQRDPEKAKRDPGEAGQRAAKATGLPWTMTETEGWDANDLHVKKGLLALCSKVMELRRK